MQEILQQLAQYIRGIWRQRWYSLLAAWLVALIGWSVVYKMPDQFEASTRIEVDTTSLLQKLLKNVAQNTNPNEQVRLIQAKLISRPNLEKIIYDTDMDLSVEQGAEFDKLVDELGKDIRFRRLGKDALFTITYQNKDPQLAKKVVIVLSNIFKEAALGENRKESTDAINFLDEQIEEYTRRLEESERRLKEFKRDNVGRMPEQGKDYYARLQEATAAASLARIELNQSVQRAEELRRQLVGEEPSFGVMQPSQNVSFPEIDNRISSLQGQLSELRLQYTDKHPDVVNTLKLIEDLENRKIELMEEQAAAGISTPQTPSLATNPVYQELKIAFGQAQANAASLRSRYNAMVAQQKELEELVHILPEVEEKLANLNRDYDLVKGKYDEFIEKREQARIVQQKEQTTGNISFREVDPPKVTEEPVAPNRLLLYSAVLIAAMGVGLGLAFVLAQLKGDYDNTRSLSQDLKVPVLGEISMVLTDRQKRMKVLQNIVFVLIGLMLIPLYGVLLMQELGSLTLGG